MRAKIKKTFRFEAAHSLPNHDGKCRGLHGHSYKVVVVCEGEVNQERGSAKEGMVIDFADLKKVWTEHIEPLVDHKFLNDSLDILTTAENIAFYLLDILRFEYSLPVCDVEVWETETSCASVNLREVVHGR